MATTHFTLMIVECLLLAAAAGFIYGVFGGGSGLIMMPGFYYILRHSSALGHYAMQSAVATTAMSTGLLGLSAIYLQWQRNNIDFDIVKKMIPGVLLGTFSAVALLNIVPGTVLKKLFSVIVIAVAVWMWLYRPENDKKTWSLRSFMHHVRSFFIGLVWFLLGVAVFTVPYLHKCGIDMRRAVGATTVISTFFSALAGILLILTGMYHVGIGHGQLGFVNFILLLAALIPGFLAAYGGARLSVKLPQAKLKRAYAGMILIIGLLMLL